MNRLFSFIISFSSQEQLSNSDVCKAQFSKPVSLHLNSPMKQVLSSCLLYRWGSEVHIGQITCLKPHGKVGEPKINMPSVTYTVVWDSDYQIVTWIGCGWVGVVSLEGGIHLGKRHIFRQAIVAKQASSTQPAIPPVLHFERSCSVLSIVSGAWDTRVNK